jgi:hypothetical protein
MVRVVRRASGWADLRMPLRARAGIRRGRRASIDGQCDYRECHERFATTRRYPKSTLS